MTGYRIIENARLDARNTFAVPARAPLLVEVTDSTALPELFGYAMMRDDPSLVLGGGSNLLFVGDPEGVVLSLSSQSIAALEDDGERVLVRADAGVEWHTLVLWTLGRGLAGLENLALIPGTVGAAPIQNIGAYGTEVREHVRTVVAFERTTARPCRLDASECEFSYRDSLFKREPDRYIVTAVEFELSRKPNLALGYAGLADELDAMAIDSPTPSQVAEAVCRIRRRKLPDPAVLGNAGSFFKNPVVSTPQADALLDAWPGLPTFATPDASERKVSAAWLIDRCGWKGYRDGDAGVSPTHALVLVNHGQATGTQILDVARRIAASVHERFDLMLEPEPRIIGARW